MSNVFPIYYMPGQAFLAIVIMASTMTPLPEFAKTPQDLLEFYAGRGRINRLARSVGYACVAADVVYDAGPRSASSLNLCGNAGFAQLDWIVHACS